MIQGQRHSNKVQSATMLLGCALLSMCALCQPVTGDEPLPMRRTAQLVSGRSTGTIRTSNQLELRFRAAPRTESELVKLGDLVEVVSWGARAREELLELPLSPAPKLGSHQDWTAKDLLYHLELRGIAASNVKWIGPESARLLRTQTAPPVPAPDRSKHIPAFVQDRTLVQAEVNVAQVTREYLWLQTGERTDWRIKARVPVEYAKTLAVARNIVSIDGGEEPWTDVQIFSYVIRHEGEEIEIELELEVSLPPTVVVAVHSLLRDQIIQPEDVAYAPLPQRSGNQLGEYFDSMDDVVGKQLRRSLATGQPLSRDAITRPVVVSTNELVEVESVSGPVSVTTAAKALSAGAEGDLINIEILSTHKRLQATVMGPKQVRIAGAPPIAQERKKLR